ncbi:MAG: M28 family peptidase [Rhodothermaceae bacterium]
MKRNLIIFLSIVCFCSSVFCQTPVNKKLVKANLEFLASDELEGREAATKGEKISSLYIAKEFEKYGVKPLGDDNTYYQNFELKTSKIIKSSTISFGESVLSLKDDFLLFNRSGGDYIGTNKCVFVGYGITAEEFEYDDYSDIDVKGKTVLIVNGEPYSESEAFFDGKERTKYSGYRYKVENAVKRGAKDIIFLPSSKNEQSSYWYYLSLNVDREILQLNDNSEEAGPQILVLGYDALSKILNGEEVSYDEFMEYLNDNELPASFEFEKEISFDLKFENGTKVSRNVVGYVEGTDEKLKDKFITITAHYDHVGYKTPEEVFNGADDNGSGTVAVMEAARLLQENPVKRSVIVCLFAAEEKGLLGSTYFVKNHSSMENTMVNVNLDMVGRGSVDTLFSIGESRLSSDLEEMVIKTDEDMTDFTIDLSETKNRLFYQSDHLNFHQSGIPCMFLNDMDFADLHKITDETEKISWPKLYKSIDFTYRLVKNLGNMESGLVLDKKAE